ncbi:MAG: DUF547 domain-containing protein [Cytophagales bacterium]|nr:MAG: DUF547 domain-containing protein [Cytophagales bacterium]
MYFDSDLIKFSQDFLFVARTNKYTKSFKHHLEHLSIETLRKELTDENKKAVFWLNVYNAFVQVMLKEQPSLYRDVEKFHTQKSIHIAGQILSLRDIELGIIRRSRKGASRFMIHKFEKEMRLEKTNPLVHFALNSAALSSPPIVVYKIDELEEQLEQNTALYLKSECVFNTEKNTVTVPEILKWYRKDFGYKKGIIELLQRKEIISIAQGSAAKLKIRYKKFDWAIALNKFVEDLLQTQ